MKKTKEKILKALKNEQEIVINRQFGGFSLSLKAIKRYAELSGFKIYIYKSVGDYSKNEHERVDNPEEEIENNRIKLYYYLKKDLGKSVGELGNDGWFSESDIKRDDEILVQIVKELGKEVNGEHAELRVVKIPSGVEWEIEDYDGMETIAEKHREWS